MAAQASLLSISRTHLYYRPVAPSEREVAIKHLIDELFTECPFYGSRKLHALLLPEFAPLARNTVRSYMQEMGLQAIYPGPKLSRKHPEHHIYPYLLRNVSAAYPNHIWGVEEVYLHDYSNPREARQGITRYMGLYNHKRPHEALGYQTPVTWYFGTPA